MITFRSLNEDITGETNTRKWLWREIVTDQSSGTQNEAAGHKLVINKGISSKEKPHWASLADYNLKPLQEHVRALHYVLSSYNSCR